MADNQPNDQYDNPEGEELETSPQIEEDSIAKEAGRGFRRATEDHIRDYARQRTDQYRDQVRQGIDSIKQRRAQSEIPSAPQSPKLDRPQSQYSSAGTQSATEAGRTAGDAGRQNAQQVAARSGTVAAEGTTSAATGKAATAGATKAAAGKVAAKGGAQVASKTASSFGIKALAGSILSLTPPILGFIVGWVIGEFILKLPIIGKLLEKIGEKACSVIMIGCQFLIIVVAALVILFSITIAGLVGKGFFGGSPNQEPSAANAEDAEAFLALDCVLKKDVSKLEEPMREPGEEDSEGENSNAVTATDATPVPNSNESEEPQLDESCVKAIASAVDKALASIDKQVKYFESVNPKNLEQLKGVYGELKESGEAAKSAGANLKAARAGAEKFLEAHKKLKAGLGNIQVSCADMSLNLGTPNAHGLVQLTPSAHPSVRRSSPNQYVHPNFACWLTNLVLRLEQLDSRLSGVNGVSIGQTTGPSGFPVNSPSVSHGNGFTADLHIPCVHLVSPWDSCQYDHELARRIAETINSMNPPPAQFITGSNQGDLPRVGASSYADSSGVHDNHWHVSTFDF